MRLESGKTPQPITVVKVREALGKHVAALIDLNKDAENVLAVHRASDDIWYDMGDLASGALGYERWSIAAPMVILKSRLERGALLSNLVELNGECEGQRIPGEEMVYVLSGRLRLTVDAQTVNLAEGESAAFWSSESHRYAPSPGSSLPVRLLSISVHHKRRSVD